MDNYVDLCQKIKFPINKGKYDDFLIVIKFFS